MEGCEISFDGYGEDAEPVQMFESKRITPKKAHACIECQEPIAAGSSCVRKSYRFEGKWHAEHVCDACAEAASEFNHYTLGGQLWALFADEWEGGAHVQTCLSRLTTVKAKERMRSEWMKWDEQRRQREYARHQKLLALKRSSDV